MNPARKLDFDGLMESVALRLLGEPTQKRGNEWRYGSRGSLSINLESGTWFDHEANEGGGVLDLIRRQGHERPEAWLQSEALGPRVISASEPTTPKPVYGAKEYPYTDEGGKLLYQVIRLEPKDFRQRRPDGNGGWIWSLGGIRRVLYRLPQLRACDRARGNDLHRRGREGRGRSLRAWAHRNHQCRRREQVAPGIRRDLARRGCGHSRRQRSGRARSRRPSGVLVRRGGKTSAGASISPRHGQTCPPKGDIFGLAGRWAHCG